MATEQKIIEFIVEQIRDAGEVTFRKMFGEYIIYCDGKVVASVCDNKFFVKPTEGGRKFIGEPKMAPPYDGAKNQFLIEEQLDNREWLTDLVKLTANEIPEPKPKKKLKK